MVDLGYFALVLALLLALYSAVGFALGAWRRSPELLASSRNAFWVNAGLLTLASAALLYAFLSRDFSVRYVASYSSSDLSVFYTLSALWAGGPGSLLFWAWALALLGSVVLLQQWRRRWLSLPFVGAVASAVLAFFLFLIVFLSNPFERLAFPPLEGRGLNPLLENPGMFFHPLFLLLGYVALTIPFAFAMAALITRRLDDEWLRVTRRWTLLAWLSLGLGNLLGAQWAYVELGWGGYWAWDPVENAGLMPWLTATAFLHSMMIQRRRGMLKVWNMALVIITFHLSIFGTFLTRSGVLTSVHSFGESALGPFFLGFLALSLFGSLGLLFSRLPSLRGEDELDSLLSRESSFLFNNLILGGAAFVIFWGTIFPLLSEVLRGVKVTVGPPFYNQVVGPIFLALVFLMGLCPLIGWRKATPENLLRNFLYPVVAGLATAVILFLLGVRQGIALLGFSLSAFVAATIFSEWFRGMRARRRTRGENPLLAFPRLVWGNKPRYGGLLVHLGIILIAVGVVGSSFFKVEKESNLMPQETLTIKNYEITYQGSSRNQTPSQEVLTASLTVSNGGRPLGVMRPEKYFHRSFEQPVTEVAIRSTPLEDLYIILVDVAQDGSAALKVLVNPLVSWIWFGGFLLLAGTGIAFWPDPKERRRPGGRA